MTGSPDPSDNNQCHKEPQTDGCLQGVKTTPQTPFLNLIPLSILAWGQEHS